MKRVITGIQSSGNLTIGNYFGAIKNILELQKDPNLEVFVFIADLHAITVPFEPKELRSSIHELAKLFIASGIDTSRCHLFIQSDVLEHNQLAWILECHTYIGELERMTQYKDKMQKQIEGVSVGLLTYPALMAADILLYDANLVPVGEDQKQHLELTRNLAIRFNNKYNDIFVVPEPYITKVGSKIMSLVDPDKKMSKSTDNVKSTIFLLDNIDVSCKKIMSAVTDSLGVVNLDKNSQPGIYNLLNIYSCLENISLEESFNKFKDSNYKDLKTIVATSLRFFLTDLQTKYNNISDDSVKNVLENSLKYVKTIALNKLDFVKSKLGLGY